MEKFSNSTTLKFVVWGSDGEIRYIQVAVTVTERVKYEQEVAAFNSIRDNYPKVILTLDDIFSENRSGIRTVNMIDFLTGRSDILSGR